MGKIEEVTDVEDEMSLDKEKSKKSDTKGNEKNDELGSQVSDEEMSNEEEIDFTKSISQDELLGDIKSYQPAELQESSECEDCCEDDVPEEGGEDYFADGPGASSKSNLGSKRAVAMLIMFPMLASGGYMLHEVFGKFQFGKSSMQFTAAIGGAVIALFVMSNVRALQSAVKFVLCFAWIIFLYPTYQVYHCSPISLKNDMLGTWFSLKTESAKFTELSYVTSDCFKSFHIHAPYMLSLMSAKVALTVDISDIVNLNVGKEQENIEHDGGHTYNYFLLVSKRSVKKKFHKLNMIVEAAPKLADILKDSLKLSRSEKEKKLLVITGALSDIGEMLSPMQQELEGYGYLVRPIKFKVHAVNYIDRYAKLKNPETYYN